MIAIDKKLINDFQIINNNDNTLGVFKWKSLKIWE